MQAWPLLSGRESGLCHQLAWKTPMCRQERTVQIACARNSSSVESSSSDIVLPSSIPVSHIHLIFMTMWTEFALNCCRYCKYITYYNLTVGHHLPGFLDLLCIHLFIYLVCVLRGTGIVTTQCFIYSQTRLYSKICCTCKLYIWRKASNAWTLETHDHPQAVSDI